VAEKKPLPVVGWREFVDLPDWGLKGIRAKIDTGARTSAIDVDHVEELEDGRIRFQVVYRVKPTRRTRWLTATPVRESTVKPSHGVKQTRYVCHTRFRIGDVESELEISLVSRKKMLCRMLLGRTALAKLVQVDPSRTYLLSKPRKTSKRKTSS